MVKRLTLDFDSGHDLTVCGIEPSIGVCADNVESAGNSLSPCLSAPPLHSLSLSQIHEQWGACVLQPVKHPTPDFGSGHDLMVHEIEPCVRLRTGSMEPAWASLSLFLCCSPTCALSLSLIINKFKKLNI